MCVCQLRVVSGLEYNCVCVKECVITINVPVVYIVRYEVVLRGENT